MFEGSLLADYNYGFNSFYSLDNLDPINHNDFIKKPPEGCYYECNNAELFLCKKDRNNFYYGEINNSCNISTGERTGGNDFYDQISEQNSFENSIQNDISSNVSSSNMENERPGFFIDCGDIIHSYPFIISQN